MIDRTPYEMLQRVEATYPGARYNFLRARLSLQTGIDLAAIGPDAEADEETAARLEAAIREICPDVKL